MLISQCRSLKDIYKFFEQDDKEIIEALQQEKFLKGLKRCKKVSCRTQQSLVGNRDYKGNYAAYCKKCKKFLVCVRELSLRARTRE